MKIEEVAKIEKNGKKYYKLKIDGRNFTAFDSVEGFAQLEKGEVKAGYEAKVEYTETDGTWQGQPVKYKNIVKFSEIKEGVAEPNSSSFKKDKEVDWDGKERRMVKMNALRHATRFFEINAEHFKKEEVGLISEQAVINIAKKFEEWIYSTEGVKND